MATPDFPQERLVHDAFGYVGFLLAEVRLNARWQGVFTFFEGGNRKHKRSVIFFYTLKNSGHFFLNHISHLGVNQTVLYMLWLNFRDFP